MSTLPVIYKETPLRSRADLIERIAVAMSKRPERAEFAAYLFAELAAASGATHTLVWKREHTQSSRFRLLEASCPQVEDSFDPSELGFWALWESGSSSAYLVEGRDLEGQFWSGRNLLLPLVLRDGIVEGILSLHFNGDSPSESQIKNVFCTGLSRIVANFMLQERNVNLEESSRQLAGELWFEHNLRLVQSRINSRLDTDYVLQSAIDTLGAILKVSSCLILRNGENKQDTRITHEFVDTELSPLGLGGSTFIPAAIAEQMCEKTTVLEETGFRRHEPGRYVEGIESLFESNIRSLAGTPILLGPGSVYGALVIQSSRERKWLARELQLLESSSTAIGQALRNAEKYQEAKEQVFNLTLLGNLTRQLGTAVEQLGRVRMDDADDAPAAPVVQGKNPLSMRELEVLRLIASGLSNREIAQRLFLTESTVELHASRIRKKLKLKSRTALVKYACDNGLA